MIKKHSFANPFPSIRQKFGKNGRSNSAPGAFDVIQVNKSFVSYIRNMHKYPLGCWLPCSSSGQTALTFRKLN